jgi:RND family efflux transporter MFP subunit
MVGFISKACGRLAWTVVLCCATAGSLPAAPLPEFDGLIEPNESVELRSPVEGVVESIAVDRSDTVKRGQVLVKLRAEVEEAALSVAGAKAKFDERKQRRAAELFREKAIPLSDKEQADAEARLSALQMRHAQETLNLRIVRSPLDGVVAERLVSPGESTKDKTILKVVQIDPLRVEVVVPASWYGQIRTGMRAEVKPEIAALGALAAKVTVVDKVIDAASGTFGVRLEIPNADHAVPSGLRCKVRFLAAPAG